MMLTECKPPLHDRVAGALRGNVYFQERDVTVSTRGQTVVLGGVVKSYYQKQMAQELAAAVSGVQNVRNRILVRKECPWI